MRRFIIILMTIPVLIGSAAIPASFAQEVTGEEVKAAWVVKFLIYVGWPEEAMNGKTENFECRVLGNGRVPDLLGQFDGDRLMDKTIRVRRVSDVGALGDCHLLFIGSSEKKNLKAILKAIGEKPILTVGDIEGFAKKGGVINFTRMRDSIGLEINREAEKRAGLEISSKLLRLATIVRD